MDSATEDSLFLKLEELIQDEDKIVTIPFLTRTLNITIQDSRNLLFKYVKDQRKLKPNELAVSYILTGNLSVKEKGVFIVKEDELDKKRSLFDKIENELLFSVQKCKQIDFNVLSLIDNVAGNCEVPLLGSIVSPNCFKRAIKVKRLPTPPPKNINAKTSFFTSKTQSSSSVEKSEPNVLKEENKPKENGKSPASQANKEKDKKPIESKKGGISSFLSKGSSSSSIKSKNSTNKSGISSFLSKGSSNSNTKNEKISNKSEISFLSKDSSFSSIKSDDIKTESQPSDIEEHMEVDSFEEVKQKPVNKKEAKEKKTKNKRHREKSEEKSVKKRKRIVERNDSESDDMFENAEEDVIEKSDDEPEKPTSPLAKTLAPRNNIKKAVDKHYMDEDGFIVTKVEYVYESPPKVEEKLVSVKEKLIPVKENKSKKVDKKTNQPTLMSFFGKK